jgi:hypothetical protein
MNISTPQTPATFESVWVALEKTDRILSEMFAETAKRQEETAKRQEETDRQLKETDRMLSEKFAETDKKMQETDRRMKELQKELGGIGRSNGDFAEEYFFNTFERNKQNFFGERFDDVTKNVKFDGKMLGTIAAEYDIVLLNGKSIGIIEVKYKAHKDQIPEVIKKAETFRMNLPQYQHYRIYLGLAAMTFEEGTEQECMQQGIAIIKQVGDTVVINDTHLKVF